MMSRLALVCSVSVASMNLASAQTDQDLLEVARSAIKTDRQAVVVATMELTDAESKSFWPLYNEYRFEMDKVNDQYMKLVIEYANLYPTVPDDRATQMLKDYIDFQRKKVDMRTTYLKKFSKVLPAGKALRLAQVETRLDLLIQLQLSARIPLVPTTNAK
jgi:hypothetical protein